MSIPQLTYSPISQNHRVEGFEVFGDEQPRQYTTDTMMSGMDMDNLIRAAYLQICHEQQMLSSYRQTFLESQLRSHQITVKAFIRGLLLSDSFRRLTYNSNNNYRFVEICIQRVLGRNVYSDREKMAWSILLATKGIQGFVDELLNSDEYLTTFGDHVVPYQRRRILPQRSKGEVTFAHTARYGEDYRDRLPQPQSSKDTARLDYYRWDWQKNPPKGLEQAWIGLFYGGSFLIALILAAALFHL